MIEETLREYDDLAHLWKGTAIESALVTLIAEIRRLQFELQQMKEREERIARVVAMPDDCIDYPPGAV